MENKAPTPMELAQMMGAATCKRIDYVGKAMLGKHHIRANNIRRAKKQMAHQGMEMVFMASKHEEITYFWWELYQGDKLVDTSQRVKAVMERVDVNG